MMQIDENRIGKPKRNESGRLIRILGHGHGVKVAALLCCLMSAAPVTVVQAADLLLANCGTQIQFTPLATIPVDYLGWLATPVTASGTQGAVTFWPFDGENRPVRDGWVAAGVVLAGSGDIGARSVGGIIWTRRIDQSMLRYEADKSAPSIAFRTETDHRSCGDVLHFEIKAHAEASFGDQSLGRLRP